ncbi:Probable diguanylate cyclase AdrA [Pannonibacter phragmitetus]|uniref:diguanylate cyclase n=1 Tax=Pannonibacter phragmitetus TaxID=121719 RepID=A0A378ZVS2_9HYPH|nr:GGDEF domain-containing protein [Pannonibacter phragmitetus]SUB00910.1 Probable diguanylate cyclase AdrA [Pannonibacter phragmitetus]
MSATGRSRVWLLTGLITLCVMLLAVMADSYNLPDLEPEHRFWSLAIALVMPIVTTGPFCFVVFNRLRQAALREKELEALATRDSLTSVLNRGAFTMLVSAYLDDARRQEQTSEGALLIVDADHFKSINDTFGHQTGDTVLKVIARAISSPLRKADLVGRVGGEEFCVFLPGISADDARSIAEAIRCSVREAAQLLQAPVPAVSVSVGGVAFREPVAYDRLYEVADLLLYKAKNGGRDRIEFQHFGVLA